MNQGFLDKELVAEQKGVVGVITLNRPKALNALSLEMIRQISGALKSWEKEPSIKVVLFKGAGDRAFCAGGDLKIFHRAGMDSRKGKVSPDVPVQFFAEEYRLNRQIFHYPKLTIGFMNGITMGGGFGIAGNCKLRIATEKTAFAMPETGIGFFPDVGSAFHLLKSPHHIGRYLALTAVPVGYGDMIFARLAEYFIYTDKEEEFIHTLQKTDPIQAILKLGKISPQSAKFRSNAKKIESIFGLSDVAQILSALEKDTTEWGKSTLEVLSKRSPASVTVTFAHLERCRGKNFDEVIAMDFVLAQHFLQRADLYEGIRAVLIDRDNTPRWDPPAFNGMSEADVGRYFRPTGYNIDDVEIFRAESA
jgi:enoyl-CoA hydratase